MTLAGILRFRRDVALGVKNLELLREAESRL